MKAGNADHVRIAGNPLTFGDGVVAIVTGKLAADGTVNATDMITKCPSKYESATGATPIADLMGKGQSMEGKPVRVTAYVKPGSITPACVYPEVPCGPGFCKAC